MAAGIKTTVKTTVKDKGFKRVSAALKKLKAYNEPYVKIGVLSAAGVHKPEPVNPDSKKQNIKPPKSNLTVAQVAAIHEFGAPSRGIPERSFMRSTFAEKRPELIKTTKRLFMLVQNGKMDVFKALSLIGLLGANEIKKKIKSVLEPGLTQATKDRKQKTGGTAKDTPLIFSGQLINSMSYEVVLKPSEDTKK